MMTDQNALGGGASCICSLYGALACRNGSLKRGLDGRGDKHYCNDLDEISGQERDDAGCQRGGKGHLSLDHEPCGSDYVEDCGGKGHGDEHNDVFARAGFVSAQFVVEETCDESHRNVSDDVAAGDAEGNANPSGPARKNGNAYTAEEYVDELAESAELRAQEDPREEDRKGRKRNRNFSGQRHREGSQYAGNRGAEGAENEIVCCHFHVVVNLRIV